MSPSTLLIVDDNPQNLKLARVLLSGEGYEVRSAVNAEEALHLLDSYLPQLILMDVQLPGMDGLQLTQILKSDSARRDIKIIVLTAYAMKGDRERALAAGCDGYIAKPIDILTLPKFIAEMLEPAAAAKQSTRSQKQEDAS